MGAGLAEQLEEALATRDLSKRAEILRRVTDLFVVGSGQFSAAQIALFDDVMGKLVETVECAARATFGTRMAKIPDAPANVIRMLAFDDAVEVAAPVLEHSRRLGDDDLSLNARSKSQGHLLAISRRSSLAEAVTDVLVRRGNQAVVASTAGNPGARFSMSGMSTLVQRSRDDCDLALCVWSRPDISRRDLIHMFVTASELVRNRLEASDPRRVADIRIAVAAASEELQAKLRRGSHEHDGALSEVKALHAVGKLDEARLREFAERKDFDRSALALSLLCDLPIGLVERAVAQDEPEQVLIIAKSLDLAWETLKAILCLRPDRAGLRNERLNNCLASYLRLKPRTAQAALQFYRLRARAASVS
jgi:uncharacterized protein (DUF2336 family)